MTMEGASPNVADAASASQRVVKAMQNPLAFLEAEEPFCQVSPADHHSLVRFLCVPGADSTIEVMIERYREISRNIHLLPFVPDEQRVLEKLVWPLRHAIGSYMTGNFLGTIAMCGLVSEMVAILIFDLCGVNFCGKEMDENEQEKVFGSSFEKLGQDRRVKVLDAFGMIDKPLKDAFDVIRTTRRKYLHLWSQDHEQLPKDAIACFNNTVTVVASIIGARVNGWAITFNPQFEGYLKRHGLISEVSNEASNAENTAS